MADDKFEALYKKHGHVWVRRAQDHFARRKEGMPGDLTPEMISGWIEGEKKRGRESLIQFRKLKE